MKRPNKSQLVQRDLLTAPGRLRLLTKEVGGHYLASLQAEVMSLDRSVRSAGRAGVLPITAARIPAEILAAITLAAVAVPEVMGYTKISGTPVITDAIRRGSRRRGSETSAPAGNGQGRFEEQ